MADRLRLREKHRRTLEALVREHLPDVEAWACGSRVNGRGHDGSDLDLVLRGPGLERIPAEQLSAFADAVYDSTIPFLVEVRDWAQLPQRFQREVERRHAVLSFPPTPWRDCRLGEVIRLRRGHDLPKRARVPGSFPIVSSSGVIDCHAEPKAPGPGVAIGRYGTLGKVYFVRQDYWPLNTTLYVEDFKGSEPRYVSYLLETVDVHPFSDKAAVPGLNRNHLHQANVRFTSDVDEQRAIASILGTLDDKIELNRRMNKTLESMARALFKSWFVDFEPVQANVGCADVRLPAGIGHLFPDGYDDSTLGRVPNGWKVVELTELIDVNPRRPRLRKGDSAPYVPMSSMPTSGHTPSEVVRRPFGSGTRFINGDTLMARITPCLENGKTAFVDFLEEGQVGWGSTEYIVLRPKPILPAEFAYCLSRSPEFRDFAIRSMTGTSGRQRVQPSALGQFLLPHPPERVAKAFGKLVRPLIERGHVCANESRTLVRLRDAVLPKLISGEIRAPQAERIVEGVLGDAGV